MVHALSRPWERTNGSSRVKHSWCGSRGSASTSQKARSDFLFPDYVSKFQPLPPEIPSNLKVCHPSITTVRHIICWSYVSPASRQGPGYRSAISARLTTSFHSHHFPRGSVPPHAPDTSAYVTASLESHIALGWWSVSTCFCLTRQGREGGRRGFICVETSHFPQD